MLTGLGCGEPVRLGQQMESEEAKELDAFRGCEYTQHQCVHALVHASLA